jgi:hypothetical protein
MHRWLGRGCSLSLVVRRFRCLNTACAVVTFAEQVPGLTSPHTPVLQAMLAQIGLALAGRAGARLAATFGIAIGRDTLLRTVRELPEMPPASVPRHAAPARALAHLAS